MMTIFPETPIHLFFIFPFASLRLRVKNYYVDKLFSSLDYCHRRERIEKLAYRLDARFGIRHVAQYS
jgi:hypothetical protein